MSNTPEFPRQPDGEIYLLTDWELRRLGVALDAAVALDIGQGLSGETAQQLATMFPDSGPVFVTIQRITTRK